MRISDWSSDVCSSDLFDRMTSSLVFHHLTTTQKRTAGAEARRVLAAEGELHVADWVQAANPLMRALFWSVQLLDGVEITREHAHGRLAELLTSGGPPERNRQSVGEGTGVASQ